MKIVKRIIVLVVLFAGGIYCGKFFFGRSSDIPAPAPTYFNQSASSGDSLGMGAGTITGKTIEVKEGQSIQEAVGKATPGDLIRVFPGIYHETVYIDKDNISYRVLLKTENGQRSTVKRK